VANLGRASAAGGTSGQPRWAEPSAGTTNTGNAKVDAFLWLNRPGVSGAGGCNGAPQKAGTLWPDRALMFARYATDWRRGAAVLASSQATSVMPVYAFFLIPGFGNAVTNISYQSLLQDRTPDALRGRVIAANEAVLDTALLVGAFLAGWIGTALGVRAGFAIAGLTFLGTGALAAAMVGRKALPDGERPVTVEAQPSLGA
jgi:MFS family permease